MDINNILWQFQRGMLSLHQMETSVEEEFDIGLEVCVGVQQTRVGREKQERMLKGGEHFLSK